MNLDYSPVLDESGRPGGVLAIVVETTDRVLAERRIASETERQRRLFEQAPGFITILHGPEHRFEFVNQAYRRLFGDRDFVGRTVRDVFPELEGQGFYEWLDQVYATGERFVASHVPARLHTSPSEPAKQVFLDFIYEPVRDETGRVTGIFCEGHDVTEAYLATAAVEASNTRYTSVLDAMSEGFIVLDEDYRITEINAKGLRLDGRPASELIGRTHWEVAPASVGIPVEAAYRRAMTERASVELDHHYVDPVTGHDLCLALRIYPVPGGVAAFYRDIGATRRAEAALRQSEAEARRWAALLEQLIETAPDPIWTKDEEGRFVLVHSAAAQVIGRPREALAGLGNRDLLPAEHALFYDAEDERILHDGDTVDTEEVVPDRTRGEERTFLSTKVPLRSPGGAVIGILGLARDITERKQIEARLRESSERVQLALDAGAIVGTWVWDVPGDRFTADERFARSFGLDAEFCRTGLPLERVMDSIHEHDRPRVADAVAKALGRGGSYRCEYRVRHQGGGFRWIEANGRVEVGEDGAPLRFPGVLLDIEQRRAAEAERD
jgi:PAS domain S-box-containing protein